MENNINDIEFIQDNIIEIDFNTFRIYKIISENNIWRAQYFDQEIFEEDDIIIDQDIINNGGNVFDTFISKEEFESFNKLSFDWS
jgi:hypothetical protein